MTPQTVLSTATLDHDAVVESPLATLDEVAHDMRQPIVAIQVLVESCQAQNDLSASMQWHVERIADEARELSALVSSLLDTVARAGTVVAVADCVGGVLDTLRLTFPGRLLMIGEPAARLLIDPLALRRAVANVVGNATGAAGPSGTVHVAVLASADEVCIRVDDDGPGFGGVESGHQLGLHIVQRCIRESGGKFRVAPSPTLGGARVELRFPRVSE
jgi:signal transduction histidine kinase